MTIVYKKLGIVIDAGPDIYVLNIESTPCYKCGETIVELKHKVDHSKIDIGRISKPKDFEVQANCGCTLSSLKLLETINA